MATSTSFKQECPSCEALVPIKDAGLVGRKIECPKCKYRFEVKAPPGADKPAKAPANGKPAAKPGTGAKPTAIKPGAGKTAVVADKGANGKTAIKAPDGKIAPAVKNGKADKKGDDKGARAAKKKAGGSRTLILGISLGLVAVVGLIVAGFVFWPSGGGTPKPGSGGPTNPGRPGGDEQADKGEEDKGKPVEKQGPKPTIADVSNLLPNETETVVALNGPGLLTSSIKRAALGGRGAFHDARFRAAFGFPLEEVQRIILAYAPNGVFSVLRTAKPIDRDKLAAGLKLAGQPPVNGLNKYLVKGQFNGLGNFLVKGNVAHDEFFLHVYDDFTLVFASKPVMEKFLQDGAKPKFLTQLPAEPTSPPPTKPEGQPMPGGNPQGQPQPGPDGQPGPKGQPEPDGKPKPTPPSQPTGPGTSFMTVPKELKAMLDKVDNPDKPPLLLIATHGRSQLAKDFGRRLLDAIPPAKGFGNVAEKLLKERAAPFENVELLSLSISALYESKLVATLAIEGRDAASRTKIEEAVNFLGGIFPAFIKDTLDLEIAGLQPPQGTEPNPTGRPDMGPGPIPGGPGEPKPTPEPAPPRDGALTMTKVDNTVVLNLELLLKGSAENKIYGKLLELCIQLRNQAVLADTHSRVHELAAALQKYVAEKQKFPCGTVERQPSGDRKIAYPPNTRLSWMAELLPYLGDGNYRGFPLDPNAAWFDRDGPNYLAAQVVIPQFLARQHVGDPGQVAYGALPAPVAVTYFVGMAGVGLDAAEYDANDKAVAHKLGVFGYDRVTKVADVKNGLDKVIVLIQVRTQPPDRPTPWLAGGGATVRGVSDDPLEVSVIEPFVCTEYQGSREDMKGQRGTVAIMGDGKVRFIPASIRNEDFRALCAIDSETKIDNLDALAPVIPPEDAVAAKPEAPPVDPKPVDPKPVDPKPEPKPEPKPADGARKAPAGWQEYANQASNFAVFFPEGKVEEKPVKDQRTGAQLTEFEVQDARTKMKYAVLVGDMGPKVPKGKALDVFMATLSQGHTVTEKPKKSTLGDHTGAEFGMLGNGAHTLVRAYEVSGKVYAVMVATPGKESPEAAQNAKTCLDSFKLTGGAPAVEPAPKPPEKSPLPPEKKGVLPPKSP